MAETTIGLVKTELVDNPTRGYWSRLSSFEFALAEYIDWFNNASTASLNTAPHRDRDRLLLSPRASPVGSNPQLTPSTEPAVVDFPQKDLTCDPLA